MLRCKTAQSLSLEGIKDSGKVWWDTTPGISLVDSTIECSASNSSAGEDLDSSFKRLVIIILRLVPLGIVHQQMEVESCQQKQ